VRNNGGFQRLAPTQIGFEKRSHSPTRIRLAGLDHLVDEFVLTLNLVSEDDKLSQNSFSC
jgi:hypothetical protein